MYRILGIFGPVLTDFMALHIFFLLLYYDNVSRFSISMSRIKIFLKNDVIDSYSGNCNIVNCRSCNI